MKIALDNPWILFLTMFLCFLACYGLYSAYLVLTEKPAEYVETYRGWIIIKVRDCFHPPAMHHEWVYIAYKNGKVIIGVDMPDLKADIDEAER